MTDIDLLLKTLELKDETRTGWAVRSIEEPESVAAHSWSMAFLAFLLADEAGVDRQTAVEMALVHDVHEAVSGDIMSGDLSEGERQEKKEREADGFATLLELAGGGTEALERRWNEYKERETDAARFVKDLDRIETALQAFKYHRDERYADEETFFREWNGMDEFFEDTREKLYTDAARKVFDDIAERYEEVQG